MKKVFGTIFFLMAMVAIAGSQERKVQSPEVVQRMKAEKISFISARLDLTTDEAQVFWPVYNEFEKKRFEIKQQIHEFERMPDEEFVKLSDSEIEKLTNNYIGSFEKDALLLKEYNKQFLKILPKKKVLMMYRTENEFRSHLIREYRKGQKKE